MTDFNVQPISITGKKETNVYEEREPFIFQQKRMVTSNYAKTKKRFSFITPATYHFGLSLNRFRLNPNL